MTEHMDLAGLHERLKGFKIAMLSTVAQDGFLHSRPMLPQQQDVQGDPWFVSALNTEKIAELLAQPKVGVIYFQGPDEAYVSLTGVARVELDRMLIRSQWQEQWREWLPQGPEGEDTCIIRIAVHAAEYWAPQARHLRVTFEAQREVRVRD